MFTKAHAAESQQNTNEEDEWNTSDACGIEYEK